jgi:hypothetical protein
MFRVVHEEVDVRQCSHVDLPELWPDAIGQAFTAPRAGGSWDSIPATLSSSRVSSATGGGIVLAERRSGRLGTHRSWPAWRRPPQMCDRATESSGSGSVALPTFGVEELWRHR